MEHQMILMSADLKNVYARLAARRKQQSAGVAQVEERIFRTDEVGASSASTGSNFQESE